MKVAIKPSKIELKFHATKVYPELENLTVEPQTVEQNFKSSKYGYNEVKAKAVDSSIDNNIKAENIKKDITILGVKGTYEPKPNLQEKTITENGEYTPDENYDGFSKVNVQTSGVNIDDYYVMSGMAIYPVSTFIKKIPLFDTSLVKSMSNFFYNCQMLEEIPLIDTSNATQMKAMFNQCYNLKSIPLLNTSKVTDMSEMVASCKELTEFPAIDTSKVVNMKEMCFGCKKLPTIPKLDASKVNNIYRAFNLCYELKNFGGLLNLGKAYTQTLPNYISYKLDLSYCTLLTHESLMNVINNLYDLNLTYGVYDEEGNDLGGTLYSQDLVLGSTNLAKLTSEEIAIATSKRVVSILAAIDISILF